MPNRSSRPLATRLVVTTMALLLTLGATGVVAAAGASTPAASPTVSKVVIKGYKFVPSKFTVAAGTPVAVKNKYIEGGKSGKFTVKKPGTYKFVCTLHTYMTGTLKAT